MTDVWEGPEYSYCQISTIKNKAKNDNNNNNNNNNNDQVYTKKSFNLTFDLCVPKTTPRSALQR